MDGRAHPGNKANTHQRERQIPHRGLLGSQGRSTINAARRPLFTVAAVIPVFGGHFFLSPAIDPIRQSVMGITPCVRGAKYGKANV
jgi:hypothetical protein